MPAGFPVRIINLDFNQITVTDGEGSPILVAPTDPVATTLIGAGTSSDLGLLPPGVRFVSPSQRTFVVEQLPGDRIMLGPDGRQFIELSFPHHFLIIHLANDLSKVLWLGCALSSSPVYQLKARLLPLFGAPDFEIPCPPLSPITNISSTVAEIAERVYTHSFGRLLSHEFTLATTPVAYRETTPEAERSIESMIDFWSSASLDTVRSWANPDTFDDPSIVRDLNTLVGQSDEGFNPNAFPNSLELLLNVVDRHATERYPMAKRGPRPKTKARIKSKAKAKPVAEAGPPSHAKQHV